MPTIVEQIHASYRTTRDCLRTYEGLPGWKKTVYKKTLGKGGVSFKSLLDDVAAAGDDLLLAVQTIDARIRQHLTTRKDIMNVNEQFIQRLTDAIINSKALVGIRGVNEPQLPFQILSLDKSIVDARDVLASKVAYYNRIVRRLREHRQNAAITTGAMNILGVTSVDDLPPEIDLSTSALGV